MSDAFDEALSTLADAVDVQAVRNEFRGVVNEEKARGRSLPRIAETSGIAYATLHAWLKGTYQGDNQSVASRVKAWLATREARAHTAATERRAPGFIKTRTAKDIFDVLEHAQTTPDMAIVGGAPGVGKTTAIHSYQAVASNVWIITAEPSVNTIAGLLNRVCLAVRVEPHGRADNMSIAIQERLRGREGLLIADEAQHLSTCCGTSFAARSSTARARAWCWWATNA